jgi:peptidoglycan/xylan/chitin deacetylase (PgdA/CDA1 family)
MERLKREGSLSRRAFLKDLGLFASSLFLAAHESPLLRSAASGIPGFQFQSGDGPAPTPEGESGIESVSERVIQFLSTHEIRRGDRNRKVVLMTYDDQGYRTWIEKILDVYREIDGKASFFFTGDNLLLYAEQIQRIVEEGHVFGSHGLIHEPHTAMCSDELRRHLQEWLGLAEQILPGYRVKFFRFPYGDRNERVRRVVAEFGLQSVHWNVESGGLEEDTFERVVTKVSGGSIVLGHMNRYYDVYQAEKITGWLQEEGYALESVETGRASRDCAPQVIRPSRPGYPERREVCLQR